MDWDDVRHFLALARLGSVRAAGSSLGVAHTTVLRRVQGLEQRLNTRLFDRDRDGYHLTVSGQDMLEAAVRVEQEMDTLQRGLAGRDKRLVGPVAVTCSDEYMARVLLGDLAAFCAAHPEIELNVTTDSRDYDLSRREADVAVRMVGLDSTPPEHLIGFQVGHIHMASYVARAHAERLDPDREGSEARWLAFDDVPIVREMVQTSSYPDLPLWGTFPGIGLMVCAVKEGYGLSMLPTYVGDQEPELLRLERADLRKVANIWLLSHPDLRSNARIRAVRQQIREIMSKHADLFDGERPADAPSGCAGAPEKPGTSA